MPRSSEDAGRRLTLERWQRFTEWPMIAISVVFLVAYAWRVLGDMPASRDRVQEAIMWSAWALFAVDYIVSLVLARRRWRWFWAHLLDLFIVVLPMLRPLRLLRLLSLVRTFHQFAGSALRGRVLMYVTSYGTVLVLIASLAVLDAEQNAAHSEIHSFGQALWWACATITTVGYGDVVPVTFAGRLVGVALMLGGIGIIATVAGTLSSWLVQNVSERESDGEQATAARVQELTREVAELKQMIAQLAGARDGVGSGDPATGPRV